MPFNSFENYPMSWKPKKPHTNKPLYLALADQLEADIAEGILLPGTVGSGTFVSYDTTSDTRMTRRADSSFIVEMGPIFPRSNTSDDVICMLKKMIAEPDFGKLLQEFLAVRGTQGTYRNCDCIFSERFCFESLFF